MTLSRKLLTAIVLAVFSAACASAGKADIPPFNANKRPHPAPQPAPGPTPTPTAVSTLTPVTGAQPEKSGVKKDKKSRAAKKQSAGKPDAKNQPKKQ